MRVLGHRGSAGRAERPENTVDAVRAGLAQGAAGVEVDVRLTADGVLVCSHDPDLGRVSGGVTGSGPSVAASTWSELRRLVLPGGSRLARLEEVLDTAAASRASVVVEVKPVPGAARSAAALAVGALLDARHRRHPLADRVTTSSFDLHAVAVLAGRGHRPAALLVEPWADADQAVRQARGAGLDEVHLPVQALRRDPAVVDRARAAGLGVVVWTVDEPDDVRRAAALGVDAVISDRPGAVLALLTAPPLDAPTSARPALRSVRRRRAALAARS